MTSSSSQQGDTCAEMPCETYKFLYSELALTLKIFIDEAENLEDGFEILGSYVRRDTCYTCCYTF